MGATMTFRLRNTLFCSRSRTVTGAAMLLFLLLALPTMRQLLESHLTTHMLVQIPMLVWAGWMFGRATPSHTLAGWNSNGVPGLIIALFAMLFWMIPRWLDAALSEPLWEIIKFITVPLLIGLPLGASWWRASPFTRAVVWSNGISMLAVVGWLYANAPVRVCNNYLINQQEEFGYLAMGLAVAIAIYWAGIALFGNWKTEEQ